MIITVLDADTLGSDLDLSRLAKVGTPRIYGKTSSDQISDRISDTDAVIVNKIKLNKDNLRNAKNLKLICVAATGYDNIDIAYCKENGIQVSNVVGYSTHSVAQTTVATVLDLATHIRQFNRYVVSGEYTASGVANKVAPVYYELREKTWGIVGLGNIGRAVADVAKAFGARVIANKRTPVSDYECVDIDTLCKESDIITIHCPLNDESRNLIDEKRLALMKKDVVIVNEARGAVVNEADVANAVKKGMIGAFGSDVYSTEPFGTDHPFYEIKDYSNVLLTPHAAWGSYESRVRCISIICDNIAAFIEGERKNRIV